MTYLPDPDYQKDKFYTFSYSELRQMYFKYKNMNDDDFEKNILDILHFSCFVCWVKELPNEVTIGDMGLIHEMVHFLTVKTVSIKEILALFMKVCCLY